ncbi:MAG: Methyltransferase [uncultured Gemmatimonadetes bacterium]|uniref:Methyltransferase n=1 Tax=uncultured Gemmatimonadota bacterium TaxID=203437 RepID=A0A6J4L0R7_9BACT|nr:MAG: Methyltransferase [uncultured Gemmatimonadota bacterium]
MRNLHEQNRLSWNAATAAHNSHKGDQAAFFRAGGDTLFPEELELLGELEGRDLLHLQCNAGQDTLSLARRGARATGVDISDEAVRFARELSAASGIAATFERADVYDWLDAAAHEGRSFDVVFSSYGTVVWLSDLGAWARGIAGVLRPGGRFVLVEFHPAAMMLGQDLRPKWPYSSAGAPIESREGVGDYVAGSGDGLLHGATYEPGVEDFQNPQPSWEFAWGIADVATALLDAGLALEALREWPFSNGCVFYPDMRQDGRRFYAAPGTPDLPLMFGVAARR